MFSLDDSLIKYLHLFSEKTLALLRIVYTLQSQSTYIIHNTCTCAGIQRNLEALDKHVEGSVLINFIGSKHDIGAGGVLVS